MNVIEQCVCVGLDISLWTATARIKQEDLDPQTVAALPPEALATLGSKKLLDPNLLRPITAVKSSAFRLMYRRGCKFLGGFIINVNDVDEVSNELQRLANDYDAAVDIFIKDYDDNCDAWLAQFPAWAPIIRKALPSALDLRKKFGFHFQMYQVKPVEGDGSYKNNNLQQTMSTLGDTALEEITELIRRARDEVFHADRDKFSKKSFHVFDAIFEKCDALAFLNPSINALKMLLRDATTMYANRVNDIASMQTLGNLLDGLADPMAIDRICKRYYDGVQSLNSALSPFQSVASVLGGTPTPIPNLVAAPPSSMEPLEARGLVTEDVIPFTAKLLNSKGLF